MVLIFFSFTAGRRSGRKQTYYDVYATRRLLSRLEKTDGSAREIIIRKSPNIMQYSLAARSTDACANPTPKPRRSRLVLCTNRLRRFWRRVKYFPWERLGPAFSRDPFKKKSPATSSVPSRSFGAGGGAMGVVPVRFWKKNKQPFVRPREVIAKKKNTGIRGWRGARSHPLGFRPYRSKTEDRGTCGFDENRPSFNVEPHSEEIAMAAPARRKAIDRTRLARSRRLGQFLKATAKFCASR